MKPGPAVLDDLGHAPEPGGHDREAICERLDRREGESLVTLRRHDKEGGSPHCSIHILLPQVPFVSESAVALRCVPGNQVRERTVADDRQLPLGDLPCAQERLNSLLRAETAHEKCLTGLSRPAMRRIGRRWV